MFLSTFCLLLVLQPMFLVKGVDFGGQLTNLVDSMTEHIAVGEESQSGNLLVENVLNTVQSKSSLVANTVASMYDVMTSEDENFRFDLIFEQITPDVSLSPLYHICLHHCSSCNETATEIVCRVCCPEQNSEPISFSSMAMQSGYSVMITNWLLDSMAWTGMKPVFGSWLQSQGNDRQAHDSASVELKSVIRRFQWLQWWGGVAAAPSENLASDREDTFSVDPEQNCGYYEDLSLSRPEGRIMGGTDVDKIRQYPWQMSLSTGYMGIFYQHRCGASLISENWALSAAHCLQNLKGQDLYVMGGFLDINEKDTAQITKVEAYFSHENFVPQLYEQDIALLRLANPIVYTPSLLPVCLPKPSFSRQEDYSQYLGQKGTLSGWGRQWDDGPLSNQLEMVQLPIISNNMCMGWYNRSGSRQFIPENTFLCAGFEEGGMDACNGDSGGPLVVERADGRAELMGVVSWGIGCGDKGRPGVYTRVSQFVPWIEKTIRDYETNSSD